jgi:hypothetical protein
VQYTVSNDYYIDRALISFSVPWARPDPVFRWTRIEDDQTNHQHRRLKGFPASSGLAMTTSEAYMPNSGDNLNYKNPSLNSKNFNKDP